MSATQRMTNAIRLRYLELQVCDTSSVKLPSPSYVLENLVGPIDLGWRIGPPTTGLPLLLRRRRRWTGPQTQLLAIPSAFVIPDPVRKLSRIGSVELYYCRSYNTQGGLFHWKASLGYLIMARTDNIIYLAKWIYPVGSLNNIGYVELDHHETSLHGNAIILVGIRAQ